MKQFKISIVLAAVLAASFTVVGQELVYEGSEAFSQVVEALKYARQGSFEVMVPPRLGESSLTVNDIYPNVPAEGIELAVYDGDDWRRFVSSVSNEGVLHWNDAFTSEDVGDFKISTSMRIAYKLTGEVSYLAIAGVVQRPVCGPWAALSLSHDEVVERNRFLVSVATSGGSYKIPFKASNMPTRLQVHFADGTVIKAKYSQTTGLIVIVKDGSVIDQQSGQDFRLEVDPDAEPDEAMDQTTIVSYQVAEIARKNGLDLEAFLDAMANRTVDVFETRQNEQSVFILSKREWVVAIWSAFIGLFVSLFVQRPLIRAKSRLAKCLGLVKDKFVLSLKRKFQK